MVEYNGEILPPEVVEKLQKAVNAFNKIGETLVEVLTPVVNAMTKMWHELFELSANANPKAYYLSKHSKKARVRKKNRHRLLREAIKG